MCETSANGQKPLRPGSQFSGLSDRSRHGCAAINSGMSVLRKKIKLRRGATKLGLPRHGAVLPRSCSGLDRLESQG